NLTFQGTWVASAVPAYIQLRQSGTTQSDGSALTTNLGTVITGATLSSGSTYSIKNTSGDASASASDIHFQTTGAAGVSQTPTTRAAGGTQALTIPLSTATRGNVIGDFGVSNPSPLSNDSPNTITASGTVLAHSNPSLSSSSTITSQNINLGSAFV